MSTTTVATVATVANQGLNINQTEEFKFIVFHIYSCHHIGDEQTYDFLAITPKEIGKEVDVNTCKGDTTAIVDAYKGTVEVPYDIMYNTLEGVPTRFIFENKKTNKSYWNAKNSTRLERDLSAFTRYNSWEGGKTCPLCLRAFRAGMTSASIVYVSWYYNTYEDTNKIHFVSYEDGIEYNHKHIDNECELDEFGIHHTGGRRGDTWSDYCV